MSVCPLFVIDEAVLITGPDFKEVYDHTAAGGH